MIEIQGLNKTYSSGSVTTQALKGIAFREEDKTVLVDTQTPSNNEQ